MKQYNCPDCERTDSCDGCQRNMEQNITTSLTVYGQKYYKDNPHYNSIPLACRKCNNHISNGGSGICHCTLGVQTIY